MGRLAKMARKWKARLTKKSKRSLVANSIDEFPDVAEPPGLSRAFNGLV